MLVTLEVDSSELLLVQLRPTTFKNAKEGYELTWECWVFSEASSDLNQESERDYTELELSFKNAVTPSLSRILVNSHSQNCGIFRRSRLGQQQKRRSSSTEELSSHDSQQPDSFGGENMKSLNLHQENSLLRQKGNSLMANTQKRRPHIKSHLYSSLILGISGLLSKKKN